MKLPKFAKLVKEFHGDRTNLPAAEGWIDELEEIFAAFAITDDRKLSLEAFLLKGDANHWW